MMTTWSTFTHKENIMKGSIKLKRAPVYAEGSLFDGTEEGAKRVANALSHLGVGYVGNDGFWEHRFSYGELVFTVEKDHYIIVEEGGHFITLNHKDVKMTYDLIDHADYELEQDFYEKLFRVEDGVKIPKGTRYVRVFKNPSGDVRYNKTFIEVAEYDILVPKSNAHFYYSYEKLSGVAPDWKDSPAIIAYCKNCSPESVYVPHPKWAGNWQCSSCGMSWDWFVLKDVKPLVVDSE